MAYRDIILAETGVASYWEMQEVSGTTLNDSVGLNHATIQNAGDVQLGRPGINGGYAVQFGGVGSGYASVGDFASPLPTGNAVYSIEWWSRVANGARMDSGGTFTEGIISWGAFTNSQCNAVRFNGPSNIYNYHYANDYYGAIPAVNDGAWRHFVFTYDQTNMRLYINGTLIDTQTINGFNVQAGNLNLWRSMQSSETGPDANVCHMAVYNTTLTLAQVQAHHAAYTPASPVTYRDLVLAEPRALHYWKLDEAAGSTSFANQRGAAPLIPAISGGDPAAATTTTGGYTAGITPSSVDGGAVAITRVDNTLEMAAPEGMNRRSGWGVEGLFKVSDIPVNRRNYFFYNWGCRVGFGMSRDGTGSANLWFTFDGIAHYDTGYYLAPDDAWHQVVFSFHQWGAVQVFVDGISRFFSSTYTQNWGSAGNPLRMQFGGGGYTHIYLDELVYFEEAPVLSGIQARYNAALAQYPPGNALVTQFVAEAVVTNPNTNIVMSQITTEAVVSAIAAPVVISQVALEAVLRSLVVNAQVSQVVMEVVTASQPPGPTKTRTTVIS